MHLCLTYIIVQVRITPVFDDIIYRFVDMLEKGKDKKMKILIALILACTVLSACTFNYEVSLSQGAAKKAETTVRK